ncbi:hypothetical protein SADUNF_Sadunf19G0065400 [Salix dunnii]|uniref:Sororin C-terminal region domain-containing protein n=1 Tax=Salix dunnii TaxID=1413687 RepID=A0A835J238_9ROSI|nr:hypothetical protein SADUNF_Sadunf19G0065400 [Salix dunnii]
MEAEIMSNNNSKRRRKPLADCTNLAQTSSTKSNVSSFEKTPILSSSLRKPRNTKSNAGSTRNAAASKSTALPPPFSSTTPTQSSSLPCVARDGIFEPHSVYSRRQSAADKRNKGKGKAIAVPISFAPAPNTEFDWDKMNEGGATHPSKSCILHHKKKQRRTLSDEDEKKYALPQDFIEQQRAYFAEIDAFELSEAEVDSSNELD